MGYYRQGLGLEDSGHYIFTSPIPGIKPSSGWGQPRPYRHGIHEGLDFRVVPGTPVRAIGSAVVVFMDDSPNSVEGRWLVLEHPNGYHSRYMHLSKIFVQSGQDVEQGEIIANSGKTGIQRSKPHLHLDIIIPRDKVKEYRAMTGVKKTGSKHGNYIGVPSEPLIKV